MITYKLHLIRTGTVSAEGVRRYVGQSDPPLCPQGAAALRQLREEFEYPPVELVYSSPLLRCTQTVDILYPDTMTVQIPELMDMDMGGFQGASFDELRGKPAFDAWLHNSFENPPPGGEDASAFTSRTVQALAKIFAAMMEQRVTSAAAVTHAGVIMTLLGAVGLPKLPIHQWMVENGTGYTLLMTPQMWMRDHSIEVYSHLPLPSEGSMTGDWE